MNIDKNKQYRTSDGREVRIYATDGGGTHPIHGAILHLGEWVQRDWKRDGRYNPAGNELSSICDLVEVKPRIRRTVWLNVYRTYVSAFDSKIQADTYYAQNCTKHHPERLACIKVEIDCEEGEGLG
jgi:hypothetical protein